MGAIGGWQGGGGGSCAPLLCPLALPPALLTDFQEDLRYSLIVLVSPLSLCVLLPSVLCLGSEAVQGFCGVGRWVGAYL